MLLFLDSSSAHSKQEFSSCIDGRVCSKDVQVQEIF